MWMKHNKQVPLNHTYTWLYITTYIYIFQSWCFNVQLFPTKFQLHSECFRRKCWMVMKSFNDCLFFFSCRKSVSFSFVVCFEYSYILLYWQLREMKWVKEKKKYEKRIKKLRGFLFLTEMVGSLCTCEQ